MIKVDRNFINVVAKSLSNNLAVTVKESNTWAFDYKNKVLHYDPMTLLEKDSHTVRGLVLHEIGHVKYTMPEESSDIYKKYPGINLMYNALEDIRIEEKLRVEYRNYASVSVEIKNVVFLRDFFFGSEISEVPPVFEVGAVGILVDYLTTPAPNYGTKDYQLQGIEKYLEQYISTEAHEAAQAIQKDLDWRRIVADARRLGSFAHVQKYVDKHIFPYIKHLLEQDPQQGQQPQPQPGDGDGDGEGEDQQPQPGDGEAQPMSGGFSMNVPGKKMALDVAGLRIRRPVPPYVEASALMNPYSSYMANRIINILKETQALGFHGHHKNGKLLSKNVTRLVLGEDRVFSKRNQVDKPVYHLMILLDGSGSMIGDDLAEDAYLGAVLAHDTFKKINMKRTIVEFSNSTRAMVKENAPTALMAQWNPRGGGTNDRRAIHEVAEFIKARPDEHFLTIVIGDGQGDMLDKSDLNYIQERGVMMALGIGSGAESVARAYPNGKVVPHVSEVPNAVLGILHEYIRR